MLNYITDLALHFTLGAAMVTVGLGVTETLLAQTESGRRALSNINKAVRRFDAWLMGDSPNQSVEQPTQPQQPAEQIEPLLADATVELAFRDLEIESKFEELEQQNAQECAIIEQAHRQKLETLTVKKLRRILETNGVKVPSKARKAVLIERIVALRAEQGMFKTMSWTAQQ